MVLSWTDQCFLGVLLLGFLVILNSLRREPSRRAFHRIFDRPLTVSVSIILLIFLMIGILDSIHLTSKEMTDTDSLLDRVIAPLGEVYEKTYSAPLALNLYSIEVVVIDGQAQQIYPRLQYPPPSFKDNTDKYYFILKTMCEAFLCSCLLTFLFWSIFVLCNKLWNKTPIYCPTRHQVSALLTLFFCFLAILGSYWLSRKLHLLGTGKIGQDIFYYTVKSIRTGLVLGILTTLFMLPLALLLGIAAGYFGGLVDDFIQYLYTILSSIPGVLLITASVLSIQTYIANHPQQFTTLSQVADARLLALCFILGVTSWTSLCRLLRAEALKLREIDFVIAAKALGSRSFTILRKHLLPNVMPIILITLVLDFSYLVLAEAVLSYVGVGVSPMTISWGNMINGARLELAREPIVWWPMMSAFFLMFVLVLASNLFADAVRDALDPRHSIT